MFGHKREKSTSSYKTKEIDQLLLPSVLGILLCVVCLAGSSFAWYTASYSSDVNVIQAANYAVEATVTAGKDDDASVILPENGVYSLEAGTTYNVKLTAQGNATLGGYCILRFGNAEPYTTLHTVRIYIDHEPLEIPITVNEATELYISYQWGASSEPESEHIGSDGFAYPPVEAAD